jgi:uncharacterized membrane protein
MTSDPQTSIDAAPASPPSRVPRLRPLAFGDTFGWLRAGWHDFVRAPWVGLFFGVVFVGMGWALMKVFERAPAYTLALSAGFLLMGPFLCLGLYRASQVLERGERPDLGDCMLAWTSRTGQLAIFGFVLLVLEMLWGRATLVVFAVSFRGMPDFKGSLMALADPANITFTIAWLVVGAIFASIIYAVTAVSMPMILDRQTDAITAGLTSLKLVLTQAPVMLFWGALIALIIFASMLPWLAGLLITAPVIGHATWHAYRQAVLASGDPDAPA